MFISGSYGQTKRDIILQPQRILHLIKSHLASFQKFSIQLPRLANNKHC